jgi:hypothetical protein
MCPNRETVCSTSRITPPYYPSVSSPQKRHYPHPNPTSNTRPPKTHNTTPLPHIRATGPHIVNLPPTEPGLSLIHAAAARHAAPAEVRRWARVGLRGTGVVVGAAVEVGDGSRSVVPVYLVDGVAVFARGGDEAHCCG